MSLFILLRPRQWIKNLLVFAPLIFSGQIFRWEFFLPVTVSFFLFCLLSSACYALNDALDYERDRAHPSKRYRPVAAGKISRKTALAAAFLLFSWVVIVSFGISADFLLVVIAYALLNLAYNFSLKKFMLLDLISIGFGFLLRLYAGSVVLDIPVSLWLCVSVFVLALFLGAGKRKGDLILLRKGILKKPNPVLRQYDLLWIEMLIRISLVLVNAAYFFYVFSQKEIAVFISFSFVLYGTIRYFYLLEEHPAYPDPTDLVFKDKQLTFVIVMWITYMISVRSMI
ncbi:MAG: UbiA family prenyltransferase [Candidatus Omnitrophica bacterium]|nr:UbiA family prenyltransferase [Candidatus Omnitrophota bacterium]